MLYSLMEVGTLILWPMMEGLMNVIGEEIHGVVWSEVEVANQ